MGTRYDDRRVLKNNLEAYTNYFKERGVKFIRQYDTARFVYPTVGQIQNLTRVQRIWKAGDRFYKLAAEYYGNPSYWWIIALYNKRPTEADVKMGDVIFVPLPLERILGYLMD